jgi:hypothetical protein
MATAPWEITHSFETNASPVFAWHYWTNVANLGDPPAEFELDGPFATGLVGPSDCQGWSQSHCTGSSETSLRPTQRRSRWVWAVLHCLAAAYWRLQDLARITVNSEVIHMLG